MKKTVVAPLILSCLLVATNAFWILDSKKAHQESSRTSDQIAKYPYISKRVFADNQNDILINFQPLRKQLEQRFLTLPAGTESSFYFEYLPSGTSIRIGEDKELIAASLIKVPLVMNVYKAAELGRLDLDRAVTVTEEQLDNAYGTLWQKGAGTKLTLREAAKLTLEESDNTATHVLFDAVKTLLSESEQSLAQLDVDQNLQDGNAVVNAKSYTSILKSLYFASYINRDDSQQILGYLTKSQETRRLTAQLPNNVPVAHKNGVFNAKWSESDCGIVYAPLRPYAICIMVGLPEEVSNQFISDVSKIVYDYVTTF